MRYLWVFVCTVGLLQGQQSLYDKAFEEAMRDSFITGDERALLNIISADSNTTQSSLTHEPASAKSLPGVQLNQAGRWRLIYSTMALGNGLYGVGVPYLMKSEDPKIYGGFQLVAAAGGFYFSYNMTRDMDIPLGRVSFIEKGESLGFTSFFILHSMIGGERWMNFDPDLRFALTYIMLSTPTGAFLGNRLYNHWKPSDGQAILINAGSFLSTLNGVALHRILTSSLDLETETAFNNSYRALSLLAWGGSVGGMFYSHSRLGDNSVSTGDAYLVQGTALLGAYVAIQALTIAEMESERANIVVGMSIMNAFAFQGVKLIEDVDFSEGDAAIMALGTAAANGIWRGLSIMMDAELSSDAASTLDIATSLAGFYTTYRSVKTRRLKSGEPSGSGGFWRIKASPTLLGDFERMTPGISLQLKF